MANGTPAKSLVTNTTDPRETLFIHNLSTGMTIKDAALEAGYSENYATSGIYTQLAKAPRLRERIAAIAEAMPGHYRNVCKVQLPRVAEIESKALEKYNADPNLAIERPGLLKQIKQAAGALESDTPHIQMTFVSNIQQMVSNAYIPVEQCDSKSKAVKSKSAKRSQAIDI